MRPLHRLAREAAQSASAESIRSALTDALRDQFDAELVRVLEISQDLRGASAADGHLRFTADEPSGTARVVATRRPLVIPDARTSTEIFPGRADQHGIESSLFLPLIWGDDVRAVAILGWEQRREIDPEELQAAQLVAALGASGLARLEAEERRAAGAVQDRAVVRAGRALNATLDLQEILLTLVHEAALALDADFSGVYLGNAEQGATATAGYAVPEGWHGLHIVPGEGAAGHVLATGEPFISNDYQHLESTPGHEVV